MVRGLGGGLGAVGLGGEGLSGLGGLRGSQPAGFGGVGAAALLGGRLAWTWVGGCCFFFGWRRFWVRLGFFGWSVGLPLSSSAGRLVAAAVCRGLLLSAEAVAVRPGWVPSCGGFSRSCLVGLVGVVWPLRVGLSPAGCPRVAWSAPSPLRRLGVGRLVGLVQRGSLDLWVCVGARSQGLGGGRGCGPVGRQVGFAGAWGRGFCFLLLVAVVLGLGSVGLRLVVGRVPPALVGAGRVVAAVVCRCLPLSAVVCRGRGRQTGPGALLRRRLPFARFWWGLLGLLGPSVWAFRLPGVPVRARCQTAREVLATPGAGFLATSAVACSAPSPLGLFVPLGLCPSSVLCPLRRGSVCFRLSPSLGLPVSGVLGGCGLCKPLRSKKKKKNRGTGRHQSGAATRHWHGTG